VSIDAAGVTLDGDLAVPEGARGLVIFAHGSGSSRLSPRNRSVAGMLREAGLGTLLFDLLTPAEAAIDARTAHLRFDIALLAARLVGVTDWVGAASEMKHLPVGYFGASTGAAAARMRHAVKELVIIPGAGHLFEEPGAMEQVSDHARRWFQQYLGKQ